MTPRKRFAATIQPQLGRERDQQRHRKGEQPADHEEALAPDAVGEPAGGQVRERLGDPEGDDEAEDRALRGEAEVALADEREHAPFEPDHGADEGVQADEERELAGVLAKPEPGCRRSCPSRDGPAAIRGDDLPLVAGAGGRSTSSASAKLAASGCASAELWRRSKPMRREGVAREPAPADRAAVVARIDEHVVGQLEQALDRARRALGPPARGRRRRAGPDGRRRQRGASRR